MPRRNTKTQIQGPQAHEANFQHLANQQDTDDAMDKFWKNFRLSPVRLEHGVLSRPVWLVLIAIGPIILLILFSFLIGLTSASDSNKLAEITFLDLKDSIFVYITLSLLFGALLYAIEWAPNVSKMFRSLLTNKILYTNTEAEVSSSEFVKYLKGYAKKLHGRGRYIIPGVSCALLLTSTILITLARGDWRSFSFDTLGGWLEMLHFLTRWILAPAIWGFFGGLGLWTVVCTANAIKDLSPRFQVRPNPLHSDRAGGLKEVGDLCAQVGLLVVVIAIPAMFLSVQRTTALIQTNNCGRELRLFIAENSILMTDARFAECVYYSQGGAFSGLKVADIAEEVNTTKGGGSTLQEIAADYYSKNEAGFQRENLLGAYDIFFAIDFFLIVILIFSVFIVIIPMLDIHKDMRNFKQARERETNDHISQLYTALTRLMDQNKFAEANKLKEQIKFYADELTEIQKYPTWPISYIPVIRSYVTSSFLSALVTYFISVLNISISAEAKDVIAKLINP